MSPGRARVQRRRRWGTLSLATLLAVLIAAAPAEARRYRKQAEESYDPAYASIVVDANSGATMQASNADSPRHPASLTKIMTLYLLFERLQTGKMKLDTELPVSEHAAAMAPSKLGLKPGESIDVGTAIRAIVTKSANDVAVVVAEAIGGNELEFAKLMTAKAHALGMTHTNYHNASGLPDDQQITTAHDQAVLARAISDRFPQYFHYFSIRMFAWRGKMIRNHNHLLGTVDGVDGMKTGYIHESGFNIIVSIHRNGRHLIAVMFGGRTASARDARVLSLINNNINIASTKHTAPLMVEGWQNQVAQAAAAKEKVAAAAPPMPAPAAKVIPTVAAAPPLAAPSASPLADPPPPALGSSDPIKPLLVKTVAVQPGATQIASLSPLPSDSRKLLPAPANANAAKVTTVATVKSMAPLPPAKPAQPAQATPAHPIQVASAGATAPMPAAAVQDSAGKPRGGWMIQVGAFDTEHEAKERISLAQTNAKAQLGEASPFTEPVAKGDKTLYRARFAGLEKDKAEAACKYLKRSEIPCMLLKN
jgi:D-alanyl-D-alanine carboxypeptidase